MENILEWVATILTMSGHMLIMYRHIINDTIAYRFTNCAPSACLALGGAAWASYATLQNNVLLVVTACGTFFIHVLVIALCIRSRCRPSTVPSPQRRMIPSGDSDTQLPQMPPPPPDAARSLAIHAL